MISHDEILARAKAKLDGQPAAIEAFWDGDTSGWFLILAWVFHAPEQPQFPYRSVDIVVLRGEGGDFRLFTGAVPPWLKPNSRKRLVRNLPRHTISPFIFPHLIILKMSARAGGDANRAIHAAAVGFYCCKGQKLAGMAYATSVTSRKNGKTDHSNYSTRGDIAHKRQSSVGKT